MQVSFYSSNSFCGGSGE
ncbi:hypothetical protein LINGRAHAP2_LOCUS23892 [Linum grandiflorum]